MAGKISDELVDRIREANDIVSVIGDYVVLKKAGRNFKALCPFHTEKTSSFMVSPEKQIFHCFGCGEGGNVFNFLMKYENISFPETVRNLAQRAGIPLPEITQTRQEEIQSKEKEKLYQLNGLVSKYFHRLLLEHSLGKKANEYLKSRGVNKASLEKFQLGYAPSSWDKLLSGMKEKGFDRALLVTAGLLTSQGKPYFRNRIIFPIFDLQNRVVGFGGRIVGSGEPKYLNSPQTPIYNKSRTLYGLNWAKTAVRLEEEAVVVEGYMDVILPVQKGFGNFSASMGTSLTSGQVYLLKRFTTQVIMLYDADASGIQATVRSLDLFLEQGIKVKVISLPKGYDPDTFVQKKGKEVFSRLLSQAQPLLDWRLQLAKNKFGAEKLEGKIAVVEDLLPTMAKEKNLIRQREQIKWLARELSLEEGVLWLELQKLRKGRSLSKETLRRDFRPPDIIHKAEAFLIQLLLEDKNLIALVQEKLGPDDFVHPAHKRIAQVIFDLSTKEETFSPARIMDRLRDESLAQLVTALLMDKKEYAKKDKVLNDLIKTIKDNKLKLEYGKLEKEIAHALEKKEEVEPGKRARYLELLKYFRGS
jgi:DNA primase